MDDDDDNDEEEKKAGEAPSPAFLPLDPSLSPLERSSPGRLGGWERGVRVFESYPGERVCGDDGLVSHAQKRAATFRSDLFFLIPLLDIFIAPDATCTCL